MNRKVIFGAALAAFLATFNASTMAQEEAPWEHAPETLSPQWCAVFEGLGASRFGPFPAPDDIDGWRQLKERINAVR